MTEGDLTPKEIGGFRILRRLASGAASDVLLARAEGPHGFQRVVALKILLARPKENPDFERTFAGEASAYARLSHPAVVKLYDFFAADGQLVLVLEYVDGLPLHKLRAMLASAGERIDDKAALFLGLRVFSALAAAHGARDATKGAIVPIVHYDVNPSNILVPWDGQVKLGDFGIAHAAGIRPDPRTGFIKGTYGYNAPEQVNGNDVTLRADIYSAGLILWELLARRKAVQRGTLTDAQVVKAMAHPEFPALELLRPDLDVNVRNAVRRALEPDPARRTITAEDVVNVLRLASSAEEGRKSLASALSRVKNSMPEASAGGSSAPAPPGREPAPDEEMLDPEQTAPFAAMTDDDDLGKISFYGRIMLPVESNAPPGPGGSNPPAKSGASSEPPAATTGGSTAALDDNSPTLVNPPRPVPRPAFEKKASYFPSKAAPPLGPDTDRHGPTPAAGAPPSPRGVEPHPAVVEPPPAVVEPRPAVVEPRPAVVEPTPPVIEMSSVVADLAPPAAPTPLPPFDAPAAALEAPAAAASAPAPAAAPHTERSPEASSEVVPEALEARARSGPPGPSVRPNAPPYVPSSLPPAAPPRSAVARLAPLALVTAVVCGGVFVYLHVSPDALLATAPPSGLPAAALSPPAPSASTAPAVATVPALPLPSALPAAAPASASAEVAATSAAPAPPPALSAAPSSSPVAATGPSASTSAATPPSSPPSAVSPAAVAATGGGGDMGKLELPARAAQHRIFVDGKVAGEGTDPLQLHCGSHVVRIGSAGTDKKIDIPCGGSVSFEP